MNDAPKIVDLTWLSRACSAVRDRPTSTWLPPGQRLVGRRFNDGVQPEWMDDAEWELRNAHEVPAPVAACSTRLKRVLCERASLSPPAEVHRDE